MIDHDSPEWLDERRSYIGASEAADALGLSPWGDPISVWESKVDGEAPPRNESFRMRLGTLVEPIIGKLAEERLTEFAGSPIKLRRVTGPIRLPGAPFIASNPDFRIVGRIGGQRLRGLVQAKFKLDGIPWGEPDDAGVGEGIPLHYRIQGWAELLTTGADVVFFAVLDPRSGLGLWPLSRRAGDNEQSIEDLRADLVDFWTEYVEKKIVPPPTARSSEALARRYPRAVKVGKVASAEQEGTLVALLEAVETKKAAEEEADRLKNIAKAMIGSADYIEGAGKRFHWANVGLGEDGEPKTKTIVDWEHVARSFRVLITDAKLRDDEWADTVEGLYTREEVAEPSRRFTIGEIK